METGTCLLDKFIVDFSYQKVTEISRMTKQFQNSIKILFVCHGNILKSPRKASKINGFTAIECLLHHYYTIFSVRALNDKKQINYKRQRPLKVGAAVCITSFPCAGNSADCS